MSNYRTLFNLCSLFCLLQFSGPVCAQEEQSTSVQAHMLFSEGFINANSPDAWSMIKYGDANVNLYTGSIGLTIPVYTYQDEDFTIPISFDYASTGYKPNIQTGVLGMGWYLNVGGAITREVKGVYDEEGTTSMDIYSFDDKWKGSDLLEDTGHKSPTVHGYGALYNLLADFSITDYYTDYAYYGKVGEEYLPILVRPGDLMYNYTYEMRPDVFHFSFLGHSGSFILQPNKKVIVFNSNHPAKEYSVEVTLEREGFTSFVITTGDKTKYSFEKIERAKSGSASFSDRDISTANGWKLTQIEAPNGRTVEFTYGKSYRSYNYIPTIMKERYILTMVEKPNGSEDDRIESNPVQDQPTVNDMDAWCLTSIKIGDRAEIAFSYSDKKKENGVGGATEPQKLDAITVYNSSRNPIKSCMCHYRAANASSDDTYDPRTSGITFLDRITLSGDGTYHMQYNDAGLTFPSLDTYAVDWFGYYNITTNKNSFMPPMESARLGEGYLKTLRQSNFTAMKYGMLTGIQYPTGGSSQFEYEQNQFGQDMTGVQLSGADQPTAGLRIAAIRNYDGDGTEVLCRSFSYIDEAGKSSGRLLWRPIVYSQYEAGSGGYGIDRETLSSSSDFPYSIGTHIEYLRVVEESSSSTDSNKSLTEYHFHTSWDAMCRDEIVSDEIETSMGFTTPTGSSWAYELGSNRNRDAINRYVSFIQSRLGGKLISQNSYAGDLNHPIEKRYYNYYYYNPADIPFYDARFLTLGYSIRYKYYFDTPYLCRSAKETYDEQGVRLSESVTEIELDDMGRTARTITTDSKGGVLEEEYHYHPEVPAYLTEHIVQRNNNVIEATRYNFELIASPQSEYFYVPSSREKGMITPETTTLNLNYYIDTTYDRYDSEGRPIQITDKTGKSTCILWGYGGLYPVAKIENTTYMMLRDMYGIPFLYSGALPLSLDTHLRTMNAENVYTTTYTYKPLVGITSMKDPSGHSTTYEYDNYGKLLRIKDHKGQIIKSYEYNIVTDNNR